MACKGVTMDKNDETKTAENGTVEVEQADNVPDREELEYLHLIACRVDTISRAIAIEGWLSFFVVYAIIQTACLFAIALKLCLGVS